MKFVVLAVLVAVAGAESELDLNVNLRNLPMQNPDLFQGDILGFEPGDRNVIPDLETRWTARTVPYVMDSSFANNPHHKDLIQQSIRDYHTKTCIRFIPRSNQRNYIRIFPGAGCYSYIGMIGGEQPVSIGQGCMHKGTIVHEFGHAIGFFHEQTRSDRDYYVIIYWDNIHAGVESAFAKLKPEQNLLLDPFDYDSIMLYGNTAFSKDGSSFTMAAKNGEKLYEPYDKPGLSPSDVIRVNKMYRC